MKGIKAMSNKEIKGKRLDDFIKQLESRRDNDIASKNKELDYLQTYNEWETKRNQQLEELIK